MEKTRLPIEQITPGMRLAEPITNAAGITLMPVGLRLTPMFIARIKKWNIETLAVTPDAARGETADDALSHRRFSGKTTAVMTRDADDDSDKPLPPSKEQFARAVTAEVSRTFVNARKNPLMMQLRAIVIRRIVQKGPDAPVNRLRRGPLDQMPLPDSEDN